MDNPAYDPFVLAVGAADPAGTRNTADDVVPEWSSRGDGERIEQASQIAQKPDISGTTQNITKH